jgi:hypothetical protein
MTILHAQNALLRHFVKNDTLIFERDLDGINLFGSAESEKAISADERSDINAIKGRLVEVAVTRLVENKIVSKIQDGVFMLNAPIGTFSQDVSLSPEAASIVADVVNMWRGRDEDDNDEPLCDMSAITEVDIMDLVSICMDLMEESVENNGGNHAEEGQSEEEQE